MRPRNRATRKAYRRSLPAQRKCLTGSIIILYCYLVARRGGLRRGVRAVYERGIVAIIESRAYGSGEDSAGRCMVAIIESGAYGNVGGR